VAAAEGRGVAEAVTTSLLGFECVGVTCSEGAQQARRISHARGVFPRFGSTLGSTHTKGF
jgi:hypothetical protein